MFPAVTLRLVTLAAVIAPYSMPVKDGRLALTWSEVHKVLLLDAETVVAMAPEQIIQFFSIVLWCCRKLLAMPVVKVRYI